MEKCESQGCIFCRNFEIIPPPPLESLPQFFDQNFSKKLKMFPSLWFLSIFSCFLPFYGFFVPLLSVFLPFFKVFLLFHCYNWSILKVFPKYLDQLKLLPPPRGGGGGEATKYTPLANHLLKKVKLFKLRAEKCPKDISLTRHFTKKLNIKKIFFGWPVLKINFNDLKFCFNFDSRSTINGVINYFL